MAKKQDQSDTFKFASLAAHQLKSPVAAVKTILRTILGEWAGPLTEKQKELLAKADIRCDQAIESIQRILTIARGLDGTDPVKEVADIAAIARRAIAQHSEEALRNDVAVTEELDAESVLVWGHEAALSEAEAAVAGARKALKHAQELYEQRTAQKQQVDAARAQRDTAEANLKAAQSRRSKAQADLDRAQKLFQDGAISQERLDTAQTQYETATAQVQSAEAALQGARDAVANAQDIYDGLCRLVIMLKLEQKLAEQCLEELNEIFNNDVGGLMMCSSSKPVAKAYDPTS